VPPMSGLVSSRCFRTTRQLGLYIVFSVRFWASMRLSSCLLLLSFRLIGASQPIDLTYSFDEKTIYWPTSKGFEWTLVQHGRTPAGYFYSSADYAANEHGGTHLDAPVHFREGGASVGQIPVTKLIGPLVIVDVSAACVHNPDYRVSADDLIRWEKQHGRIPDGAILLIRTGWGKYWPDKKRYLGTDKPGDIAGLHFPGISGEAAEFLVKQRKINGDGIDAASIDYGQSKDFIAHRIPSAAGIYNLENVANLDRVPATGATLIALPMKTRRGTGAPVRIVAMMP
jgi:kynurenine formamidase